MVSVLASSALDRGFEPRSSQTEDYKIVFYCFSAEQAALRRKSKDWLSRIQNNVSEWSDMSTRRLLFQWVSTIKLKSACWSSTKLTSSSSHWQLTCSRDDIAEELLNLGHTHSFGGVRVAHHFCVVFLFVYRRSFLVPTVADVAGLSSLDCPSVFSNVYI